MTVIDALKCINCEWIIFIDIDKPVGKCRGNWRKIKNITWGELDRFGHKTVSVISPGGHNGKPACAIAYHRRKVVDIDG